MGNIFAALEESEVPECACTASMYDSFRDAFMVKSVDLDFCQFMLPFPRKDKTALMEE